MFGIHRVHLSIGANCHLNQSLESCIVFNLGIVSVRVLHGVLVSGILVPLFRYPLIQFNHVVCIRAVPFQKLVEFSQHS